MQRTVRDSLLACEAECQADCFVWWRSPGHCPIAAVNSCYFCYVSLYSSMFSSYVQIIYENFVKYTTCTNASWADAKQLQRVLPSDLMVLMITMTTRTSEKIVFILSTSSTKNTSDMCFTCSTQLCIAMIMTSWKISTRECDHVAIMYPITGTEQKSGSIHGDTKKLLRNDINHPHELDDTITPDTQLRKISYMNIGK